MNLIELDRALKQLRLGGMAALLETRLRQLKPNTLRPIDLLSCWLADELALRGGACWSAEKSRPSSATRRDLDNFDFAFNKKMKSCWSRSGCCAFIARHEDALFLGPPGTGKVTWHKPSASAIQQDTAFSIAKPTLAR